MEIVNFRLTAVGKDSKGQKDFFGTVTVIKKHGLFWKKRTTEERQVYSEYGSLWIFTDNGEYAYNVSRLFEAEVARRKFSKLSSGIKEAA